MKILLVADLHYALKQFDWLAATAPDFDLVVVAGDLLDISSAVDTAAQIVVVRTYLSDLARVSSRIVVCSGNHDLDIKGPHGERIADWLRNLPGGIVTDGDRALIDRTLVSVCPWWDGPETRSAVAEQLARDAAGRKGRWIWIYHAPPSDSPVSWGGKRHFGDTVLAEWIARYQPDMVLSGHVHQSPFVSGGSWADQIDGTWVFNVGKQPGPAPTHAIFDLDAWEAVYFSLEGAYRLDLSAPLTRPIADLTELPDWLRA